MAYWNILDLKSFVLLSLVVFSCVWADDSLGLMTLMTPVISSTTKFFLLSVNFLPSSIFFTHFVTLFFRGTYYRSFCVLVITVEYYMLKESF